MNCKTCGQEIKASRTAQQNRYYWKCISLIAEHLGYTPEEMSVVIKDHFNWYETIGNTGLKNYESSAKWSKDVFAQRTETIIQFAAECGVVIQTPEEFFEMQLTP